MKVLGFSVALGLTATCLAAVPLARQQAVFRATATYVEVATTVVDKDGRFVDGLTTADFEIQEDFRKQPVATLTQVDLPTRWRPSPGGATPPLYRPDMPRNLQVAEGRVYLIYLNAVEARHVAITRKLALDFVRDYLMPEDVVALWSPNQGLLRFTNDRVHLSNAIRRFLGTTEDLAPTMGLDMPLPSLSRSLTTALDWFSSVQGRKKSLLLFSAGWEGIGPVFSDEGRPSTYSGLVDRPDVQIYAVDVRGLVAPNETGASRPNQLGAAGVNAELDGINSSVQQMRWLAEDTGGFALVNHNEYHDAFRRIVDENSRYYLLGYESPRPVRKGWDFRSIRVRVTKPGLKGIVVRSRQGYVTH
jgi:VWFA-related protein